MTNVEQASVSVHAAVPKRRLPSAIRTDDLLVNVHTNTVTVAGTRVRLTGKEYEILRLLSVRYGHTISKEMLLNHLYSGVDEPNMRIIDVFLCKLRKKLFDASGGKNYIQTVWGRGYLIPHAVETEAQVFA
jgi:two-component system cell cycle response regulator CtrA